MRATHVTRTHPSTHQYIFNDSTETESDPARSSAIQRDPARPAIQHIQAVRCDRRSTRSAVQAIRGPKRSAVQRDQRYSAISGTEWSTVQCNHKHRTNVRTTIILNVFYNAIQRDCTRCVIRCESTQSNAIPRNQRDPTRSNAIQRDPA